MKIKITDGWRARPAAPLQLQAGRIRHDTANDTAIFVSAT